MWHYSDLQINSQSSDGGNDLAHYDRLSNRSPWTWNPGVLLIQNECIYKCILTAMPYNSHLLYRSQRNRSVSGETECVLRRLVLKCGLAHLNANANARDESNANANASAQHLNQMQMQMQMRSSWIKCKCKCIWIKCKCILIKCELIYIKCKRYFINVFSVFSRC